MNAGEEFKVNLFIAGCQKAASTWLHRCFQEHPEIYVPGYDAIHFFTVNYYRGTDWYHNHFEGISNERAVCDPTPSYIRDSSTAQRIHAYNPEARLLFVLRNPIERAFSHYWHKRRKGRLTYRFSDALFYNGVGNYDLYNEWIQSGFYADLLSPFFETFPPEQLKILLFDDLEADPRSFLREVFNFAGVDETFEPSLVNRAINTRNDNIKLGGNRLLQKLLPGRISAQRNQGIETSMPEDVRAELRRIFEPKNRELEKLLGRSLSIWQ